MTYCVDQFQGLVPVLDSHALPVNAALCAKDVDLSHGRIDPWREPLEIHDLGDDVNAAHVVDCCWVGYPNPCTKFYTSDAMKQTYISVPCECPLVHKDWCNPTSQPITLGLPVGETPTILSNTPVTEVDEYTESRLYVTTFCGPCGEGAPSLPTAAIKADKDSVVTLEVCPPTDTKYEVTHVNIYATHDTWDVTTGFKTNDSSAVSAGFIAVDGSRVECFLVGSVPVSGSCVQFTDSGDDATQRLGRSLVTEGFNPPPEGLCIVGETDAGSLVGFVGKNLYLSERFAHWAWPSGNRHLLSCEICAVCVMGDTVVVLTDGNPYILTDNAVGGYEQSRARTIVELPISAPAVSEKSVVCTNTGVVYASHRGLMRVTPQGQVDSLSATHFGPDDWQEKVDPYTIRAAEFNGAYFFTSNRFSGIFDLNLRGQSATGLQNLTHLSVFPECWITDKHGDLHFLIGGKIFLWDAGPQYMTYTYRTAYFPLNGQSLTAAQIEYSGISRSERLSNPSSITINSDGRTRCVRHVNHKCPFRISVNNAWDIQVELTGTRSIRRVCVATDTTTLGT